MSMDTHAEYAPDTTELSLRAVEAFVKEAMIVEGDQEDQVLRLASKIELGAVERSLLQALLAAGRFDQEERPVVEQALARTSDKR